MKIWKSDTCKCQFEIQDTDFLFKSVIKTYDVHINLSGQALWDQVYLGENTVKIEAIGLAKTALPLQTEETFDEKGNSMGIKWKKGVTCDWNFDANRTVILKFTGIRKSDKTSAQQSCSTKIGKDKVIIQ